VLHSSADNLASKTRAIERDSELRAKEVLLEFERSLQSKKVRRQDLQNQLDRARQSLENISDPRFQLQKLVPLGNRVRDVGPRRVSRNLEMSALAAQIEETVVALTQARRAAIAARRKSDEDENRRRLDEAERLRREAEMLEKQRAKRLKLVKVAVIAVVVTALVGATMVLR
jgi:hypothetical protein